MKRNSVCSIENIGRTGQRRRGQEKRKREDAFGRVGSGQRRKRNFLFCKTAGKRRDVSCPSDSEESVSRLLFFFFFFFPTACFPAIRISSLAFRLSGITHVSTDTHFVSIHGYHRYFERNCVSNKCNEIQQCRRIFLCILTICKKKKRKKKVSFVTEKRERNARKHGKRNETVNLSKIST